MPSLRLHYLLLQVSDRFLIGFAVIPTSHSGIPRGRGSITPCSTYPSIEREALGPPTGNAVLSSLGRTVGEVGQVIATGPTPLTPPGQKVMVNPSIEPVSNLKTSWTLSFQVPLAFSLEASTA